MKKKDMCTLIEELHIEYKVLNSCIEKGIEFLLTRYDDFYFIFIRDSNGFHCIDRTFTLLDAEESFENKKTNILFHLDLGTTSVVEYHQVPIQLFPATNYILKPFKPETDMK
jgi:hypothetical protein